MNIEQIQQFMVAINCKDAYISDNDWVRAACPLAPFLHKNGKDTKPSFGVHPVLGGAMFHCFTCLSGTPESLVATLEMYLEARPDLAPLYDLTAARAILDEKELNIYKLPPYEMASSVKLFEEWPTWFKDIYLSAVAVPRALKYLTSPKPVGRALSLEEVIRWDFRYDLQRDMVVFPFYDMYGRFAGMRGRSIEGKSFHDYTWNQVNNTSLTWGNESVFQNDEPLIVVEGQFDLIRLTRLYPHVIANLTAKIPQQKVDKLLECRAVVLYLDNDETGIASMNKIGDYLASHGVQVGVVTYTPDSPHDPDESTEEEIRYALKDMIPL